MGGVVMKGHSVLRACVLSFFLFALSCLAGAEETFTFIVMGDPQPYGASPEQWQESYRKFLALIPEINRFSPDFLFLVGDYIVGAPYEGAELGRMWDEFDRVAARIEAPVWKVPGNHDIWNAESRRTYTKRYGPTYFSFDNHGCHFIGLDTELTTKETALSPDQLAWLETDLKTHSDARFTFVFLHQPLWDVQPDRWNRDVHPLLAKYGVDFVFAGHDHIYRYDGMRDGVAYTITGGANPLISGGELNGEFNHFIAVTVRQAAVYRAVIKAGAVLPYDVATRQQIDLANRMRTALSLMPLDAEALESSGKAVVATTVSNLFDQPARVEFRWTVAPDSGWLVSPETFVTTIAPGQTVPVEFKVGVRGTPSRPAPTCTAEIFVGDRGCGPVTRALALARKVACPSEADPEVKPPSLPIDQHAFGPQAENTQDFRAEASVMHDRTNLLFRIRVTDDAIVAGNPDDLRSGDTVAVAIYRGAPAPDACWTQAAFVRAGDPTSKPMFQPPVEGGAGTARRTDEGYEVEIAIPARAIKLSEAAPGEKFLCEIAVVDVDPGQKELSVYQWHSTSLFLAGIDGYGIVEVR